AKSDHVPQGGDIKIFSEKVQVKAEPKVGSLDNITHTPGGGSVRIKSEKIDLNGVSSKIGSLENINHTPGGGDVKIMSEKLAFKDMAQPRIDAQLSPNAIKDGQSATSGGSAASSS
ncbi:hypothetical protein HK405_001920, partial [Cladochytrium tenue]